MKNSNYAGQKGLNGQDFRALKIDFFQMHNTAVIAIKYVYHFCDKADMRKCGLGGVFWPLCLRYF